MYCEQCGEKLRKGSTICPNCGTSKNKVNYLITEENLPEQFKPISMWCYLGYQLLFSIPVIGWIMLIIFAISKDENINVQNFARSYFCFLLISGILLLLIMI